MRDYIVCAVIVTAIVMSLAAPLRVDASLYKYLDKGDKLVYEIYYSSGRQDYFEIDVKDKYVSSSLLYTLEISYSGRNGTVSKDYSLTIYELSMYIPSVHELDYITYMRDRQDIMLSMPIPVDGWNNQVDASSPIGARAVYLSYEKKTVYMLKMGGKAINIPVYVLKGKEGRYEYTVFIDAKSGILIRFDASYSNSVNPLFTIKLVFFNEYLEKAGSPTTVSNSSQNTTSSSMRISRIVFTVIIALASILALIVISAKLVR
jgi:hypothetical protein